MRVLAVIPARYGSRRLPGKPLIDLEGIPMVARVALQASRARAVSEAIVATDDRQIAEVARHFGFRAVLTSAACASGTDRVAEAVRRLSRDSLEVFDLVLNVQGDEPLVDPRDLDALAASADLFGSGLGTLARPEPAPEPLPPNPHDVWVLRRADGRALDFWRGDSKSRARGEGSVHAHVGVYAARPSVLSAFAQRPPGPREKAERLEQLRGLENEFPIHVTMCESEHPSHGVDTAADVARVRALLRDGWPREPLEAAGARSQALGPSPEGRLAEPSD